MRSASVECAGPGELLRLKAEYLVPCVYHFYKDPPQIVGGHGCTLVDHNGREYLDCYSGVTVMSAGHCTSEIIEPAIEQIRTLQHTTSIYLTEPVLRLAEALARITPGDLRRSFFCASGSEAVEGALLLAMLRTGREGVVAFRGGLHGRTRWAMSATGLEMWRTDPAPLESVCHADFGDIDDLRRVLDERGDRVAAIIGEPIQGNGGIRIPDASFWPEVRALCDERGIVLVLDEIQTGFNRTGWWFACEGWGVVPDVLVVSKAMGSGFPIAAFVTTDEIGASYTRPGASTYGGNPVCAAAALATIEYHEAHDLAHRARVRGRQLRDGLESLAERHADVLGSVRGEGLMLGVACVGEGGEAGASACDALLEGLRGEGVLAGKTGSGRNVLTFMPPLVISEVEVAFLLGALGRVLDGLR
jgi:4-aminobutyrate aminotransferase-like enzyme